jgi:hypothetical protein
MICDGFCAQLCDLRFATVTVQPGGALATSMRFSPNAIPRSAPSIDVWGVRPFWQEPLVTPKSLETARFVARYSADASADSPLLTLYS